MKKQKPKQCWERSDSVKIWRKHYTINPDLLNKLYFKSNIELNNVVQENSGEYEQKC